MVILGAGREDNGIKGFTLVEILIVISIIAILLMISNSMFTASRQRTNLREAAGALAEDMKLAKQRAVAENAKYRITFNVNQNTYTMDKLDPNDTTDSTIIPPSVTKNLGNFGSGIVIDSQTFTGNTITFQVRGTCSAGTITLRNSLNSTIVITTNLTGRVRIN